MRRATSSVSGSLNCAGAERSALSRNSITSAVLRAGRLLVPLKITSSMPAARSDLCEVSPITQPSGSTRLDLPQPFGPTRPVSPCSIWKSVGSTKDLKPSRRSLLSFIGIPLLNLLLASPRRARSQYYSCGTGSADGRISPDDASGLGNESEGALPQHRCGAETALSRA